MNPPVPNPRPENPQSSPDRGCGVSPQAVQGASRSESSAQDTEKSSSNLLPTRLTDHRSLGTSSSHSHPSDDMGFVDPPEMLAEPEYESDYDFEEDARERELLMDDLADDNDDFARSEEDGWYYSDED
jgi:hypothetical protein